MSDLFDDFSTSALNDHSAEFSVSRIISESNLEGSLAGFIGRNFPSVTIREQEKFLCAVNSAALEGDPHAQLAAFLRSYQPRLVLDGLAYSRSDNDVADTLKEELQNWNIPENAHFQSVRCFPSKLTEQLKDDFFPDSPLELCKMVIEFAEKNVCSKSFLYLDILRLYGKPFEVLLNASASGKIVSNEIIDTIIWQPLQFQCRGELQKKDLQQCKDALDLSARWHKRLIAASFLEAAEQWEEKYRSIYHRDLSNADTWIVSSLLGWSEVEGLKEVLAEHIDLLTWQRLCHPDARPDEADGEKWLSLSFEVRKSFCHPGCTEELIDQYILESLKLFRWHHKGEFRVPPLENIGYMAALTRSSVNPSGPTDPAIELPREYLHKLWYSSPYRDRYLAELNAHLANATTSKQLEMIEYLLDCNEWRIRPHIDVGQSIAQMDSSQVHVEKAFLTEWASALVQLGNDCLNKKTRLTYQELNQWLELVYRHKDLCSVRGEDLVPFADKALAFMRNSLHGKNEHSNASPYLLLHRILLRYAPEKFLLNMLQAFRHCPCPCSGERLEYAVGSDMATLSDHPAEWGISIQISNCLRLPYAWQEAIETYPKQFGAPLVGTEAERRAAGQAKHNEIATILRRQLAQFCLKSLRLKKNEQCKSQYYTEDQCIEPNHLWRQGVIRALAEIGLDFDGQVHRALNFVANNDPHHSVREDARAAYKSVRRQEHHRVADPIKGMLIAFWILRLAQRRALNQTVNPQEAALTRRNELRYATKVRYIIPYIRY